MSLRKDRLLNQLNNSGLQNKDFPLYQVITQLIDRLRALESATGGVSTSVINNIENILNVIEFGDGGGSGEDGPPGTRGIDGVAGAAGITGAAGPLTLGPMGLDGIDGNDGMGIPGPSGSPGITGLTGPTGPAGANFILLEDYSEDVIPIPGPAGTNGTSGSSTAVWEGKVIACMGNGDPTIALTLIQTGVLGPTPTQMTTTTGRVSYFMLKTAITVANIRWYGIAVVTSIYHIAIYRASDNVRMSADNTVSTTLDAWNAVADAFTLAANTLYYAVVSVGTTGATAGIVSFGGTLNANTGQIRSLPTAWPGNLDWDNNYVVSQALAVVAVTAGALPSPGNAPTVWATNPVGGMPAIFLDAL